jgi:hypothetical protein
MQFGPPACQLIPWNGALVANLLFQSVDDLFEMFSQDMPFCNRRSGIQDFVLIGEFRVDPNKVS